MLTKALFLLSIFMVAEKAFSQVRLCYEEATLYPWITGEEKGLVFTEISLIEKKLNMKFALYRLPWKRCLQAAKLGEMDGIIGASFSPPRTEWAVYPEDQKGAINHNMRLYTDNFVIYVHKDSPIKFKGGKFQNLAHSAVGCQLGYSVEYDLQKAGLKTISTHVSALDLLKELDYGSIGAAVLLEQESKNVLSMNPKLKKHLVRLDPVFNTADKYIIFSKGFFNKNSDLAHSIWNAVPEARNSEIYARVSEKIMGKLK